MPARRPHLFIAKEKDIFDLVTTDLCARLGVGVGAVAEAEAVAGTGSNARQPFVYLNKNKNVHNNRKQRKLTANS